MNCLKIAALVAVTAGIADAQRFTGSFPFVTNNGLPVGLESNGGGDLLYTDLGVNDEIGRISLPAGTIAFAIDVSAQSQNPLGITFDASTLTVYVTDSTGDDVDLYDAFGGYLSSFSVAAETTFPEGITFSPVTGNLYVTSGGTPEVFEYTTAGTLLNTFSLNGTSVDGIAHDPSDNTFWVYDSGTDSLRNYSSSFFEISSVPGTAANGLSAGEGVAVIGDTVYVCATGSDEVATFDISGPRAEATPYGTGCPAPTDFYEDFGVGANDLAGTSFTITPTSNGFTVTNAGSFDPVFSNNLSLSDDQLAAAQPLGFTATFPKLGTINTIDIDSNGRIGVNLGSSDFSESVNEFLEDRMLGVCWDDFNPASAGAVFFDTRPNVALVTWNAVPQFGQMDSNTFQVKLYSDGRIECNYGSITDDGSSDCPVESPGWIREVSTSRPRSRSLGLAAASRWCSRPSTARSSVRPSTW